MFSYNWDWSIFFHNPPGILNQFYYQWILTGLYWTVLLSLSAWIVAVILGITIAVVRTMKIPVLSTLALYFVELIRNIPFIVQLFFWFFVLPELVPHDIGMWIKRDIPMPEFFTSFLGLSIYTATRVSEIVMTGINTRPIGQKYAAQALGFGKIQTYRLVLLPVAMRMSIPPLTSEFMSAVKNSSVALTIGVTELTFQMRQITGEYAPGNPIEVMCVVTLIYALLSFIINLFMSYLDRKTKIPGLFIDKSVG